MEIKRDTGSALMASLDGNDTFINSGHQIIKTAGATHHAERMSRVPVWALDDDKIKELITARFPKSDTNPRQRQLASRMVRFIYLYYRTGMTMSQVAEQLGVTMAAARCLRQRIVKSMSGPLKGVGRPKKPDTIETESEVDFQGKGE